MTICVSVKVSEGLVLAADSTAAVQGSAKDPSGKTVTAIVKTYDHVRKLSHIKDYPIGTLTWGAALVGARSVESLIKEYEYSLPSLGEEEERIKERRKRQESGSGERYGYSVKEIAAGLSKHIKYFYDSEFPAQPAPNRPQVGILVSGYSSGKFFPEQWLLRLPDGQDLEAIRPDVAEGKPSFGSNWFGLTDAIVRLHWGRDDQALAILSQRFKVPVEELRQLLEPLQYQVVFDGMPLQDAIDYAAYVANLVIGRFRFGIGAPLCGGDIDLAVITPDAFTWVRRKSWHMNAAPMS